MRPVVRVRLKVNPLGVHVLPLSASSRGRRERKPVSHPPMPDRGSLPVMVLNA